MEALAAALGVSTAALRGREPLPPPPVAGAAPVTAPADGRIPEVEFLPVPGQHHPAAELERRERRTWVVPADLLAARDLDPATLVVVRSPEPCGEIRAGDRVLLDTGNVLASPPGMFLLWDGWAVRLRPCALARHDGGVVLRVVDEDGGVRQSPAVTEVGEGPAVEILGRLVARWAWT